MRNVTIRTVAATIQTGMECVTTAPILPKHLYQGTDPLQTKANLHPVGTGPFTFVSYTAGDEVRVVCNKNYFKSALPYLDEVVFRVIPDTSTQLAALEGGEVDYVWRVPGPDIARLQNSPNISLVSVTSGPGGGFCIMTLTFNLERPIFQDLRVRQAFAHAISAEYIKKTKETRIGLRHASGSDSPFP